MGEFLGAILAAGIFVFWYIDVDVGTPKKFDGWRDSNGDSPEAVGDTQPAATAVVRPSMMKPRPSSGIRSPLVVDDQYGDSWQSKGQSDTV